MPWYAASVIEYVELIDEPQEEYSVWENVYLFHADDADAAQALAEKHGHESSAGASEGMTFNGKPARLVFGGVRKLISCAPNPFPFKPGASPEVETIENGVEATYSSFLVSSKADLDALVRGEPVRVLYEE
ncbi:DUF4288 domain-containing protein [Archangium sp.]|uniref:DUF4288 domain-containing protein n=1 Tax=Archangium sp. TaxID=1872627 RepID=UPI002D2DD429|nr:hypothetical protein [Archangium sp.]HYO53670.1 hypothetical protein [Archangium sp.]